MGKTKYYATRIGFHKRGSSYAYSFKWVFDAPNIENVAAYIEFIEKTVNAQFLNYLNDPELFKLPISCSKTCLKYNKNECRFSCGRYFTEKTITAEPLDSKFSNDEKQEILTWRNTLLN